MYQGQQSSEQRCAAVASRAAEIPEELKLADQHLTHLHETIKQLADRLVPITRTDFIEATNPPTAEAPCTPIAVEVRALGAGIQAAENYLYSILNRLEV